MRHEFRHESKILYRTETNERPMSGVSRKGGLRRLRRLRRISLGDNQLRLFQSQNNATRVTPSSTRLQRKWDPARGCTPPPEIVTASPLQATFTCFPRERTPRPRLLETPIKGVSRSSPTHPPHRRPLPSDASHNPRRMALSIKNPPRNSQQDVP